MTSPAPEAAAHALRPLAVTIGAMGATAALGLGYGWCEARAFTVRRVTVPVLPPGAADLRVLHMSDLHLRPYQLRKRAWIRSLAALEPDLVVNTGDSIAHPDSIGLLLEDLGPLLQLPGLFVLGSNDYFEPSLRNPFKYLLPDDGGRHIYTPELPWRHLVHAFREAGWTDLGNRRDRISVRGLELALAGVDDPHLGYDDLEEVAGPADPAADLRVAVTHAPYLRVLDQFAADGYDIVFAGHTHGGQVRLPGAGALVTNCDLEPARARGLHRHPAETRPGDPEAAWLHVSAGAGTSPYVVVRFCCRPEATLLTLTGRPDFGAGARLG